jgi:hypothetical protein
MKSLGKLRKFALYKSDSKEKKDQKSSSVLDDLVRASQEMHEMRNCYDSLLSAAAATANSAYEFSESLQEMGTCLQEKTSFNDDGESGRLLVKLGQVQLELQKLVDSYRSHIILTITNPSESLLSELRKVEEMKLQCDEKREVYEYMVAQHKEKGRSRSGKLENFTPQQLQEAQEDYDEVARLCVFRVKSLKEGQCRSLLTQAARHHTAQLNFFKKGTKSLEAVEPTIRVISEKHHIDYQLSGLDDVDGEGESVNSYKTNDAGEVSFDYRQNKQSLDNVVKSRISMELDRVDAPFPQNTNFEESEMNFRRSQGDQVFGRQARAGSYSAPIYPEKFDPAERIKEMQTMQTAARRSHTYVLPTPIDPKASSNSKPTTTIPISSHTNTIPEKRDVDDVITAAGFPRIQLPSRSSNEGYSVSPRDTHNKKNKRQAFSGPLASKPWSSKPFLSGPIVDSRNRSVSPPPVSSPKVSELHELPRPPPPGKVTHTAPLFRNQEASPTTFTLPVPPSTVPRSFSIPSGNQRAMAVHVSKFLESPQIPDKAANTADVVSPPLTPISLSNMMSLSSVSGVTSNSGQIRGGS